MCGQDARVVLSSQEILTLKCMVIIMKQGRNRIATYMRHPRTNERGKEYKENGKQCQSG